MTSTTKPPLLGQTPEQLTQIALDLRLPRYTGQQLSNWLYQKHVSEWDQMTNLSKKNRTLLSQHYNIGRHPPIIRKVSKDGSIKYLFASGEGYIETVMIPDKNRATLCVSSQRGCKMNCLFCMTGKQGFSGHLTPAEILNQILSVPEVDDLTNIVFMGMGEPMDNINSVLQALSCLTHPRGLSMSPKRITVSTIGLMPGLQRFLEESTCHLAISLHNPIPSERLNLMPLERHMPIEETIRLLSKYDFRHQRRLTFEYIIFSGLNDTDQHLRALIRLLRSLNCHVNLIRYHRIPNIDLPSSQISHMEHFRDSLIEAGIPTTIRTSRGEDICAACGMLSTQKGNIKI